MSAGAELPVHVLRSGRAPEGDTEVFVLLHGFGASSFTWRQWMAELERRGHVIRVDLLGFGASPKPEGARYDPLAQAELVLEVVDTLGVHRPTFVGHSLGGGVAIATALHARERGHEVRRIVVVSGAAYRQRLPPFVRLARFPAASAAMLSGVGPRIVVGQVLRSIVFDPTVVTTEMVEGYAAPLASSEAVRALVACAGQIEPRDLDELTARYRELDLPVLLLWGRHDGVVPPWVGARLARELPRARLRVLERCGHVPQEELPGASWAEVAAFLDDEA